MSSTRDRVVAIINQTTLGTSIAGVSLSILLLAAIVYLQWNPVSRPHLNRVSFRLLIHALVANVILGATMWPDMEETTPTCSLIAFLGVGSSAFSAAMFACMALNLQLVLVYHINGNKMEKYYMLGAVLLTGACTIPAWASGAFGWYSTNGLCWLRDPTPTIQLHWLIGTQSVPMLLLSTVEVISFVNIITFMVRHHMKMKRLRPDPSIHSNASRLTDLASTFPLHPIVQFRGMIFRIAMYPLLSCFLSTTACILDVYSVLDPDLTSFSPNLRILDLLVFSLRPLLYAFLGATDPSLVRALRSLRQKPSTQPTAQSQSQSEIVWRASDSYGLDTPAPTPLGRKKGDSASTVGEGTSSSSSRVVEPRSSTVDAEAFVVLTEEESPSDDIAHQI